MARTNTHELDARMNFMIYGNMYVLYAVWGDCKVQRSVIVFVHCSAKVS